MPDTPEQEASPAPAAGEENVAPEQERHPLDTNGDPAPKPEAEEKPAGEEENAPEGKDEDGEESKDEGGVPEKYDLKLPEGAKVDEELMGEFESFAKEKGYSNEDAQDLVDLYTKAAEKFAKEFADQQKDAWTELIDGWAKQAESDKEYGGQDFETNVGIAQKAVEAFGSDELKEALETTGMGNHPEFIRFAYKIGKLVSEDKIRFGNSDQQSPDERARRLFPSMKA